MDEPMPTQPRARMGCQSLCRLDAYSPLVATRYLVSWGLPERTKNDRPNNTITGLHMFRAVAVGGVRSQML